MLDPSILLSSRGVDWLEREVAVSGGDVSGVVVAESFRRMVRYKSLDFGHFVAIRDSERFGQRIERLANLMEFVPGYSHRDTTLDDSRLRLIRDQLSGREGGEVVADEWSSATGPKVAKVSTMLSTPRPLAAS